jgi:hypothetical protein
MQESPSSKALNYLPTYETTSPLFGPKTEDVKGT